jgi:hypothetical protein
MDMKATMHHQDEPTKVELLNDIREGLLAAKRSDPMSTIDDLWAELEAEDEAAD